MTLVDNQFYAGAHREQQDSKEFRPSGILLAGPRGRNHCRHRENFIAQRRAKELEEANTQSTNRSVLLDLASMHEIWGGIACRYVFSGLLVIWQAFRMHGHKQADQHNNAEDPYLQSYVQVWIPHINLIGSRGDKRQDQSHNADQNANSAD